jgi:hypothetical protein
MAMYVYMSVPLQRFIWSLLQIEIIVFQNDLGLNVVLI